MVRILSIALLLVISSCAHKHCDEANCGTPTRVTKAQPEFGGHCAYAMCMKKGKVMGKADYQLEYKDKVYHFSSAQSRDMFAKNIEKNVIDAHEHWSLINRGRR